MNSIDRSIDYCTSLDPLFPETIRGAAPETVAAIEAALGRPSHPVHRRFLERLGVSAGWLDFAGLDTSAAKILEAHRVTRGRLPEGYDLFGVAGDEPFEDAYLVGTFGDEPTVELFNTRFACDYGNLPGDLGELMAGSLAESICLQALRRFVIAPLPFQRRLTQLQALDYERELDAFAAVVARNGFDELWFSNGFTVAAQRAGTVVIGRQFRERALLIELASDEPDAIVDFVRDLLASLPIEPARTSA